MRSARQNGFFSLKEGKVAYTVLLRISPQTTKQNFNLSFSDSSIITRTWSAQQWKRKRVWLPLVHSEPKLYIQSINQQKMNTMDFEEFYVMLWSLTDSYTNETLSLRRTKPHIYRCHVIRFIQQHRRQTSLKKLLTSDISTTFVNYSTNSKRANKLRENPPNETLDTVKKQQKDLRGTETEAVLFACL